MTEDPDQLRKLVDMLDYSAELSEQRAEYRRQTATLLTSLLEVMDSFDRLFGDDPDPSAPGALGSCRLIARQLADVLERSGVRPVPCAGATVDPRVHQVVGVRPAAPAQDDTVLEVVRTGYEWHGAPLRPAQVIVGRSPEEGLG